MDPGDLLDLAFRVRRFEEPEESPPSFVLARTMFDVRGRDGLTFIIEAVVIVHKRLRVDGLCEARRLASKVHEQPVAGSTLFFC